MLNTILDSLKELNIENYIINEISKESAELFFIKKELDMRRMCDTTEYVITVFRDFEFNGRKMRGSSGVTLYPGMSSDEIVKKLSDTYSAAQYVKNPWFEMYAGEKEEILTVPSQLSELSVSDIAEKFTEALFKSDVRSDSFINSAEIFAKRTCVHIITSSGSDVGYIKNSCSGEFIVQCRKPKDVEQYFDFDCSQLDTDELSSRVAEALSTVCNRSIAEKSPVTGEYDIVLTDDNLRALFDLYLTRASASTVFAGYSDYAIGKKLQGESIKGDAYNVSLIPSVPYSADGIPMAERTFIENGELKSLHGTTRFCRYLGIEPTGIYDAVRVSNGTVPFDEMKKGCLYPVSFSDFQMDPMDGHFKGEIRLAYYYGENGVELLTGGSVNGSLLESQSDLVFSTERYRSSSYDGPLAVKVKGVTVAG